MVQRDDSGEVESELRMVENRFGRKESIFAFRKKFLEFFLNFLDPEPKFLQFPGKAMRAAFRHGQAPQTMVAKEFSLLAFQAVENQRNGTSRTQEGAVAILAEGEGAVAFTVCEKKYFLIFENTFFQFGPKFFAEPGKAVLGRADLQQFSFDRALNPG